MLNIFYTDDMTVVVIRILTAAALYVVFHFISVILLKSAPGFFKKILKTGSDSLQSVFARSFARPAAIFLRCLGAYLALISLPLAPSPRALVLSVSSRLLRLALIVAVSAALQGLAVNSKAFFSGISEKHPALSPTILGFFTKLGQAVIIALTVVIVLKELGYDVNGLIAGLGLSGLTFALAAQDTASNFVSGLVILMDKPFGVGDWISVGGMEGIVEEMNFRSCRIRTFDNALISVPNSKISGDSVTNWTKMNLRKTSISIGLLYSTDKRTMQSVCARIKENLAKMPEIKTDSIMVRFDKFSRSSLDIFISYNSYPIAGPRHFALKEKVQYMIMDVVAAHDTDFAYNSMTIYNG